MKNRISNFIKRVLGFAFSFLPLSRVIIFESAPDFSDNTKAVYDEMLKRGLNRRYKLVWLAFDNDSRLAKAKNVQVLRNVSKLDKIKKEYFLCRARCIVCCNHFIRKNDKRIPAFYLTHGTPSKSTRNYYTIPSYIDYCTVPSEGVAEIYSYHLNFPIEKIYPLGFPRNDDLYRNVDIKTPLGTNCDKIIVWYPTFRQMKKGLKTASTHALPVIHDAESAKRLNEVAVKNNTLIVLKPHFAQDVSYVKDLGLSNIRFIDDSFFTEHGMTSYQFVGSCDALITDYSSIYYDFTLCDKPIAAIWEDIEEYKQNPGLIDNFEYYMKGAEKVYTADELGKFISDVANGIDSLKEERNEIKNLTNYSTDGRNSERVVDFIIEKAKL